MSLATPPAEERFMEAALDEARAAHKRGEVPVGCVIVVDGQIVAQGSNRTNETRNATRHAELEAIDQLLAEHGRQGTADLMRRADLYVTCEPCIMCAGALSLMGLRRAFYGCANDKFGGCGSILPVSDNGCGTCGSTTSASGASPAAKGSTFESYGGIMGDEAIAVLKDFYIRGNPGAPKPHRKTRGLGEVDNAASGAGGASASAAAVTAAGSAGHDP